MVAARAAAVAAHDTAETRAAAYRLQAACDAVLRPRCALAPPQVAAPPTRGDLLAALFPGDDASASDDDGAAAAPPAPPRPPPHRPPRPPPAARRPPRTTTTSFRDMRITYDTWGVICLMHDGDVGGAHVVARTGEKARGPRPRRARRRSPVRRRPVSGATGGAAPAPARAPCRLGRNMLLQLVDTGRVARHGRGTERHNLLHWVLAFQERKDELAPVVEADRQRHEGLGRFRRRGRRGTGLRLGDRRPQLLGTRRLSPPICA